MDPAWAQMMRMLGGNYDMATGESWRSHMRPLTAAQQELFQALNSGEADEVAQVLAAHPGMDVNFLTEEGGFSCLHLAAMRNQPRVCQLLLDAGADVDQRAPSTREPPLLVASCYGCVDVVRLLLERGADPHVADWGGNTALARSAGRVHMGPRFAETHRLIQEAVSATAPLSRAAKREGGCGGCGRTDGKMSVCARCGLRSYCSRECQLKDFKTHKQRCKAVGEFRKELSALADPAAGLEPRRTLMKRLERDRQACQLAVELKGVRQLLEGLPSDPPLTMQCLYGPVREESRLLMLCALGSLLIEGDGPAVLPPHQKLPLCCKDATHQFAAALGMEVLLERILAADCPPVERVNGIRILSALCQGHSADRRGTADQVVPRRAVAKGRAPAVVGLLARLIAEHGDNNAIFANACICLAALAAQEGPSFEALAQQQAAGGCASSGNGGASSSAQPQEQGEELGPVAAAIFEHVDMHAIARRLYSSRGVAQAAPELLLVLSRSRAAFERLVADPLVRAPLLGAYYSALFLACPSAWGPALEFWTLAHLWRPGLLVKHWPELQGVLEVCLGDPEAAREQSLVLTLLDPLAPNETQRAQQGVFVSSGHALKAARLLAAVATDPQLPRPLLNQLLQSSSELVRAVQACKDEEAARVLREGISKLIPKVAKLTKAEGGGGGKKKTKGGRRA